MGRPRVVSDDPFVNTPQGQAAVIDEFEVQAWIDAGQPSHMALWVASQRGEPVADSTPLTVAAAAVREGVSTKTIRRLLPDLAASDPKGAWKVKGGVWRIDPAALTAARTAPVVGDAPSPANRPRRRRSAPPSSTRWEA